eukprot:CAMPEP_0202709888 /NCGR_PEP_ID=MMETSP1385-20130828/21949_1 /ASSEMBLY_ACC=CAM_ASM_000861 /TAXON_ID=933848 /ORGANISM="Elphidium margaritaceum" /LENGTH=253 /DNA_ID=CAMNT_0049369269 /DNA_START=56 /DNA_END=817 /DNA_ORIENTATION=+
MAGSSLLDADNVDTDTQPLNTIGGGESTSTPLQLQAAVTPKQTDILPDGTVCKLYNQLFSSGTQCKIDCYLPSTKEYVVIITHTNSRLIVNMDEVHKWDAASSSSSSTSYEASGGGGGGGGDSPSISTSAMVNDQLIKHKSAAATEQAQKHMHSKRAGAKHEQDYTQFDNAADMHRARTRKSIVCFVVIGVVIMIVGICMFVSMSEKQSVKTFGIIFMALGIIVIICGVLRAKFDRPTIRFFGRRNTEMTQFR